MPKTKLTPFSRLLLFLLIFVPIAYVGASYYNGEDPVANIKKVLGMDETNAAATEYTAPASSPNAATTESGTTTFESVQKLREENTRLLRDLAVAREELARCQAKNVE
jgi:hypothetical protein